MKLNDRFEKAVKQYVVDGSLTKEEKEDLLKIATEDGINETDAIIYINIELKKVKRRKQIRDEIVKTTRELGSTITSVGGFALTVFLALKKIKK